MSKHDKHINTKKPTGDTSFLPIVRRGKHSTRGILGKMNALTIKSENSGKKDEFRKDRVGREKSVTQNTPRKEGNSTDTDIPDVCENKKRANMSHIGRLSDDDDIMHHFENHLKEITGYFETKARAESQGSESRHI